MAEKLSIQIDLSEKKAAVETLASIAPAPPDVVYHYDRIFVALIVTVGILYAAYYFIFGDNNENVTEPPYQTAQTLAVNPKPATNSNDAVPPDPGEQMPMATDTAPEITPAIASKQPVQLPAQEHEQQLSVNKQEFQAPDTSPFLEPEPEPEPEQTQDLSDNNMSIGSDTSKEKSDFSKAVKTALNQSTDRPIPNLPTADVQLGSDPTALISQTKSIDNDVTDKSMNIDIREAGNGNSAPTSAKEQWDKQQQANETQANPAENLKTPEITNTQTRSQNVQEIPVKQNTANTMINSASVTPETEKSSKIIPVQVLSNKLSRVQLTSSVYKKEPVDQLSSPVIGNKTQATKIYLFTQLDNSKGSSIEHQWWHKGKLVSKKKFTALGNRWRCYSSKNISKYRQGDWQLKVVDENGKLMAETAFEFKI